jgi:hypothetical protein
MKTGGQMSKYFDGVRVPKMSYRNQGAIGRLQDVLSASEFVTLRVSAGSPVSVGGWSTHGPKRGHVVVRIKQAIQE